MTTLIKLAEHRKVPDWIIRKGIRKLLRKRLADAAKNFQHEEVPDLTSFIAQLDRQHVAVHTDQANRQHYEVPPEFFEIILGPRLKYSSGYWPQGCGDLGTAEEAMLALTCERAELKDGMDILELGCGWGSLTTWMAERFPQSHITAVSNSQSQIDFIRSRLDGPARDRVTLIKADVNAFSPQSRYDRVVSVEMFEHMRNYSELFKRISGWLDPKGKLFVHVFSHRTFPYLFETEGASNWMGRYFFTGGTMPSHNLFPALDGPMKTEQTWALNGRHYAKTLEEWLVNLDKNEDLIRPLFREVYGNEKAETWIQRWRIFIMSCAELFAYGKGGEWGVSHYLFSHRASGKDAV